MTFFPPGLRSFFSRSECFVILRINKKTSRAGSRLICIGVVPGKRSQMLISSEKKIS